MDTLSIARKVVKGIAMVVGLGGTVLCLMALVGLAIDSGWVRAPVAIIVAIAIPALITDRLLPDEPSEASKGLTSDVFALTWMVLTVGIAIGLGMFTRPLLAAEGDRLTRADLGLLGKVAYLLAGVDATTPEPTPSADPSATTSASAAPTANASAAPTASATAGPTASASASASATASASASAAPEDPPKKDDEDDDALSPAELFKEWAPSVVTVSVKGPRGDGGGTGFLIDAKGTIATNHHVIAGAKAGRVKFMSGAIYEEVWLLVEDPNADLALLRVDLSAPKEGDPPGIDPVKLADSEKVEVGEAAISIGNPLGLEHTLTTGIVSARRTYRGKQWIQMTTPISPGNSGGPVFSGEGEVMGVATAVIGGGFGGIAQNLNLAVPVNQLKSLVRPTYPAKRKLGSAGGSSHW